MSALRAVRTLLVSRRRVTLSPKTPATDDEPTVETTASTCTTSSTPTRHTCNIVATVWSTESMMERDIRFNFFSVQTAEEVAVFQTVAAVLSNYGTVRCNDGTKQLAAHIPDLAVRNIAARLDSLGVRVRWMRFDGR